MNAASLHWSTPRPTARTILPGSNIRIGSSQGGAFDGYLARLPGSGPAPAIVLAPAIHGVDQDIRAPPEVLDAYRPLPSRMKNVEAHIFPGIQHGCMMPGSGEAFDRTTRDFSMTRALAMLESLLTPPP